MAFLAVLVLLRVGCNVCIDIVILRDSDSLMKTFSDLRRAIFPNWHPRTQPQDIPSQQRTTNGSRDIGGGGSSNGVELMNMDRVLAGLTPKQKQDLLVSVLSTKVSFTTQIAISNSECGTTTDTSQEPIKYENNTFISLIYLLQSSPFLWISLLFPALTSCTCFKL